MKCPDCNAKMKWEGFPYHRYEYYSCENCGAEVRIIHGKLKSAKSH